MPALAALAVAGAILLAPGGHGGRRRSMPICDVDDGRGLGVALALAVASLNAGAEATAALERQLGDGLEDANGGLDVDVLRGRLRARALKEETDGEVREVAHGVRAALAVSRDLGCPAAGCLEAVRGAAARLRLREDLRRNAFAVPLSTARLLLGLPLATVFLAELVGADPLGVLFGSWQGACLLVAGLACYAVGAAWMGRLMRSMGQRPP